jgi:hypothetical protein
MLPRANGILRNTAIVSAPNTSTVNRNRRGRDGRTHRDALVPPAAHHRPVEHDQQRHLEFR